MLREDMPDQPWNSPEVLPIMRREIPPHIPQHENEWFAHFPYPCQPRAYRELMYAFISTDGGHSNGHKAPECQLYATHIAMIVARLFPKQEHPHIRPVVGLLNFCRSGGGLDFMRREGFRSFYQPQYWPVYIMSAAQANKDALVGGLWDSYFQCLANQLTLPTSTTNTRIAAASASLHDLFLAAKAMYRHKHVYELFGHICHAAYPSAGKSFRSDLQPLLTSGDFGAPDFVKIAQLQEDYRKGGIYYRRKIYIYDTYNWGTEIDLVLVVSRCLLHIALPDCVFGELSGVETFDTKDIFHFEFKT
jgi:hypothetical protein